ncbi:unnamed protein product [Chilo suppressalis]|uniref:Major facilitator superfamily (MFS) profile domain-containing protein n=1 Tax=Chilo suppressalis TaxID=168631 RepID=A0ABN8BBY5_CHISP|nr:hypothetical protein evm_009577 [Chilo suppressalis]CAH0407459.1 unnamed protein product [Chilo suppressalis]
MKLKSINKYVVNTESQDVVEPEDDDYIAKCIGPFGTWQAIIWVISISSKFIVIANVISIVFLTPNTEFKCVKFKGEPLVDVQNSTCYEDCIKYEYYNTLFKDTLISRFDLICGDAWLASFAQSILMLGLLVGVPVIGWISDRFGRALAFRLTTLIAVIFMIGSTFAPTYWALVVLRFFVGFGTGGIVPLNVIICVESVGKQYKDLVGVATMSADGIAQMILTVIAYYSPSCYLLSLTCGFLSMFILTTMFIIPETPRWLIANQKGEEALELMTKIAKINNRDVSHIKDTLNETLVRLKCDQKENIKMNFADLFRTKTIAVITMSSIFAWTFIGIAYYGINQYSTLLGTHVYAVAATMGLFQLVGSIFSSIVNRKMRRKTASISALIACGICMMVLIFIPDGHWCGIVAVTVAYTAITTIFCVIYVQINELYPTPLRNMGFGLSSSGIKLGAMVAPFIANTHPHWIASGIFAIIPIVTIAFCLPLPETKGKSLQDIVK